jgi:nitroimidazol reductase NimA-like FMN-containing flavoprotein (pyridoxamine 5'-phosphate oxidase superfamily)
MRELRDKKPSVCVSATLMDGLVLARSAFHHSMNYRSVVIFGKPALVTDDKELYHALEMFTEKVCAGRWADVRKPTSNEWKETMVLSVEIKEASAKVRTGGPKDDAEDYSMDVWAGVVPLKIQHLTPIADPDRKADVALPNYLR